MIKKRADNGRFITRVEGEYSNKSYAIRVTDKELQMIREARKQGVDVRGILLDGIRKVLDDISE